MGLLWELNASSESESSDSINWLPISPSEYIFASTVSTSYTYSPLVLVTVGYSLPIGILTGNTSAFLVLVVASVVAAFIGSVTVEILRSLLALASSAYFLLLSLGFLAVLASAALALRAKFWVATPPSFHFSNTGTISSVSRLRKIGVSVISLALVRREIRSATRRKEVVRLMAIPI